MVPRHTDMEGVGGGVGGVEDRPEWEDAEGFWEAVESFEEDLRDCGGDEGLARVGKAGDRAVLKVRRSFELVFKTGQVVRFEVRGLPSETRRV